MKTALFPKYSNIFPEKRIPDVDIIFEGISSEVVLNILCFINAQLHINPLDNVQRINC